jgi:hypothetical protein
VFCFYSHRAEQSLVEPFSSCLNRLLQPSLKIPFSSSHCSHHGILLIQVKVQSLSSAICLLWQWIFPMRPLKLRELVHSEKVVYAHFVLGYLDPAAACQRETDGGSRGCVDPHPRLPIAREHDRGVQQGTQECGKLRAGGSFFPLPHASFHVLKWGWDAS